MQYTHVENDCRNAALETIQLLDETKFTIIWNLKVLETALVGAIQIISDTFLVLSWIHPLRHFTS